MEGSEGRKRSQSVPILSQIEKILDRGKEFGVFERRTGEGEYSRFPETRSSRNITRSKVRLSSGGLIRNQKRRHSRATMESTQTGDQGRPRAYTVIDMNTVHSLDSMPTGITTELHDHTSLHSVRADIAEPRPSGFHERPVSRKRSKSLSLETRTDYSQRETNDDSRRATEVGYGALDQEQTANAGFCGEEKLFHRRFSLPTRLQYEVEDTERGSCSKITDMTKSSSVDFTNLDKPASLIADFDKLSMIKLKRSEQEMEENFISDFRRRRSGSLPCCLEQSNLLMEPSLENGNWDESFRVDSTLQKTMKIKAQRSQSLPLTSSSFVGEVRGPLKEENSNWRNGEYSFRQPLGHIEQTPNEHSPQRKKSHKTRSKSLPLVLDEEGKANMSVNLIKHVTKQRSLQSHDRLHDVKPKTRRVKSLPFIYEVFTERELLPDAQIMHIHSHAKSSDSDRKENTISNERKQLHDNGNNKQKAQLERARSLPLRLPGGQHRQISDIQEDLNKAIDSFFSHIEDQDGNIGFRGRSKSLPNVLEEENSLNVMPVAKTLEGERNIPERVIAEGYFYDAIGDVGYENPIDRRESKQSPSREEKLTNEESNSDASSDCDELEAEISNITYANDISVIATRPRGFSIPSSFKMEKIPEEPNENENCETLSSCEHGGTENRTNLICKNRTVDSSSPVTISNVSEVGKDTLAGQADEASSAQGTTEGQQQADNRDHSLEIFNKMVTESLSRIRQLEFAKSTSCLHRAAANGDLEHVKLLVKGGDDVNALDESGWSALHAAVITGNFDCGAWLVDAGADLVGYTNFVIDEYRLLCQQVYLNY